MTDRAGTEPEPPHRRSLLPFLLPLLVLSLLAFGAVAYHVPYYAIGPGPSRSVDSLIAVPENLSFPHKGTFLLTTVSLRDVTVFEAIRGWLDADVDVVKIRKVIGTEPTPQARQQFDANLQQEMKFSRETAVEVALARLGIAEPAPDIKIDSGKVGGPSGGLALALGLIDILTEGELTGGHKVAVAGTILFEGTVGDVDGIAQKAAAARSAGAEYMLVAPRNYREARTHAGRHLTVLQAGNLDQALVALKGIGGELGAQRT